MYIDTIYIQCLAFVFMKWESYGHCSIIYISKDMEVCPSSISYEEEHSYTRALFWLYVPLPAFLVIKNTNQKKRWLP